MRSEARSGSSPNSRQGAMALAMVRAYMGPITPQGPWLVNDFFSAAAREAGCPERLTVPNMFRKRYKGDMIPETLISLAKDSGRPRMAA